MEKFVEIVLVSSHDKALLVALAIFNNLQLVLYLIPKIFEKPETLRIPRQATPSQKQNFE